MKFESGSRFWAAAILFGPVFTLVLIALFAWTIGAFAGKSFVGDNLNPGEAFVVLGAICLPLAAFVFARAEFNRALAVESAAWPTVPGLVTKSEPTSRLTGHGMTYAFDFECSYTVAGQNHRTDRVQFGTGRVGSRDLIDGFVQKYPVNSKVTVRYNPDNPSDAVLENSDEMARDNRSLGWILVIPPPLAALIILIKGAA